MIENDLTNQPEDELPPESAAEQSEFVADDTESDSLPVDDADFTEAFTGDDLEAAYQAALESVQEWEPAPPPDEPVVETEAEIETTIEAADSEVIAEIVPEEVSAEEEVAGEGEPSNSDELPIEIKASAESEATESAIVEPDVAELTLQEPDTATIPISSASKPTKKKEVESEEARVTPTQVLEAVLFVGGPPMTARKLAGVLRGSNDVTFIERTIDELNQEYAAQNRPYEIRLGDGGYRIDLRPEYERLRQRVFGGGPREVKLSQELLEILALVAYRQPISVAEIEAVGRKGPEGQLRQLLRRELIALRRSEDNPKEVRYHTTSRFLSLFGLGSLDELPQPEDVELK